MVFKMRVEGFLPDNLASKPFVEIVSYFTKLKKVGNQYVGLCPFHNEDTPSFFIHPEKELYHCFGCNASGNKIKFLKEVGIYFKKDDKNSDLEKFAYISNMFLINNRFALEHLKNLGFTEVDIKDFQIGYIDNLDRVLEKIGQEAVENLGIPKNLENFFVFPVKFFGRLVGFVFRTEDSYYNSKFSAKSFLFGFEQAFKTIKETNTIIIVEGIRDVIAMRQNGFLNTVASLGSTLKQDQVNLAFRYADIVILCPDGDASGKNGLINFVSKNKLNGKIEVIALPEGEDPRSLADKGILTEYIKPISLSQFLYINNKTIKEAVKIINNYSSDFTVLEEVKNLSEVYEIPEQTIIKELNKLRPKSEKIDYLDSDEKIAGYILNRGLTPSPELFNNQNVREVFLNYKPENSAKILCAFDEKDQSVKEQLRKRIYRKFYEAIKFPLDPIELIVALRVLETALGLDDTEEVD